jgi:hypothetical protein
VPVCGERHISRRLKKTFSGPRPALRSLLEAQRFSQVSHGVRDEFFERVHFLNRLIIPVLAPDAFEYLCVKRQARYGLLGTRSFEAVPGIHDSKRVSPRSMAIRVPDCYLNVRCFP